MKTPSPLSPRERCGDFTIFIGVVRDTDEDLQLVFVTIELELRDEQAFVVARAHGPNGWIGLVAESMGAANEQGKQADPSRLKAPCEVLGC